MPEPNALDDLLAGLVDGQRALAKRLDDLGLLELPDFPLAQSYLGASGTWTPSFAGSTTPGTFTYTNRSGNYYIQGGLLHFLGRLTISAIGTPPVGVMLITGLPFASLNSAVSLGCVTFGNISNFNYSAGSLGLQAFLNPNSTIISLRESFDNVAAVSVPAANFTNTAVDLIFSGFYPLP